MKKGVMIALLMSLTGTNLSALPSQCYDSQSSTYDLQTQDGDRLKRDKIRLYFKKQGQEFFVSGNQVNWNPLIEIANNENISQFLEPIKVGYVLYTYHKTINKMIIQKSYSSPLMGSLMVNIVLNQCQ